MNPDCSRIHVDRFFLTLAPFLIPWWADDEEHDGDERSRGERRRPLEQHGSAHQPEAGRGGGGGDAAAARMDEGRGPISAVPHALVSLVRSECEFEPHLKMEACFEMAEAWFYLGFVCPADQDSSMVYTWYSNYQLMYTTYRCCSYKRISRCAGSYYSGSCTILYRY